MRNFLEGCADPVLKQHLLERWMDGRVDMKMNQLEEVFGTDSFTSALYDAANTSAIQGTTEVSQTWKAVSKIVSRSDFKTNYPKQANGMGLLKKRLEGESMTLIKPTDRKESYAVNYYDEGFPITMEAWANDELGILQEQFRTFGQAWTHTLNNFVWNATTGLLGGTGSGGYATMSDGYALFSASHATANYATSTDLTEANLDAAITAFLTQADNAGTQIAYYTPKCLLVPPNKQGIAKRLTMSDSLMMRYTDAAPDGTGVVDGTKNWLKDLQLQVVVVPELTTTNWILSADPAIAPCLEMGFYQGKSEPTIMVQGPDSDMEFFNRTRVSKCIGAFGGVPTDWRTFYKGVA